MLPMSVVTPTVTVMRDRNNRWKTLRLLTILLGWLGVHRFYVGKIGTGVLWFFTYGVFLIGWLIDILQVLGGRFTDKSGKRIAPDSEAKPEKGSVGLQTQSGGLEFLSKGTEPERDDKGRVIVRLKTGPQIEIDLRDFDERYEDATEAFFAPARKGGLHEGGEKTVRMRLVPDLENYWGGTCYRIESPSGVAIFEIRDFFQDDFSLIKKIIDDTQARLITIHPPLADADFVFDVPVRIQFQWDDKYGDQGNETGDVEFVWHSPTLRLNDPLEIQVR